jgi:hypothetical protein
VAKTSEKKIIKTEKKIVKTEKAAKAKKATSSETQMQGQFFDQVSKRVDQVHEQLSLIHGVLEEISERQEGLAAWHMEFAKRLMRLQDPKARQLMHDELDDATKFLEELSADLSDRKAIRQEFFRSTMSDQDLFDSALEEALERGVPVSVEKDELH